MHLLKYFQPLTLRPENAKEIRGLILELAIRGRLTAEWRLEHQINPEEFFPEKTLKASLKKSSISVPMSWRVLKFSDLLGIKGGSQPPKSKFVLEPRNGYVRLFQIRDFGKRPVPVYVPKDSVTKFCDDTDVMIGRYGASIGKVFRGQKGAYNVALVRLIHDGNQFTQDYLFYLFQSIQIQSFFQNITRSAQAGFNKTDIGKLDIPLPPLPEQHAIVATVNRLLAEVDELERQTTRFRALRQDYVTASLRRLTGEDSASGWAALRPHFRAFFDQQHGVKELKAAILELAVQGKLTAKWRAENPEVEPAGVLLERIREEKERLVREKVIRREKKLPEVDLAKVPFEISPNWEWCLFGELATFINGDRGRNYPNKSEYVSNGVPWINTGHINPDGNLSKERMNYITAEKFEVLRSGKIQPNDILYCLRGATFGKTSFVTPFSKGAIASSLMIIRTYHSIQEFVFWYLKSSVSRKQLLRFDNGSAQPNLSANKVKLYQFPLPPLPEQRAIVRIVDELLALCDGLADRIAAREAVGEDFLRASVGELLGAAGEK